jgi:hypothetical protein
MTCSYETERIAEDRDRLAHNPEVQGSNLSPRNAMWRDDSVAHWISLGPASPYILGVLNIYMR